MAAVRAVLSLGPQPLAQLAALQDVGTYESPGKGRTGCRNRWSGMKANARINRKSTMFMQTNGARECARRRRQMRLGTLPGGPVYPAA